jgi:hypothetical protein
MENSEPATEIKGTGNYLGLSLIRAPKDNHKSIEQIGKPIVQWFRKHGARPEIYNLSTSEFPEGVESIAKTLLLKMRKRRRVGYCCNSIETKLMQIKSLQR